METEMSQNIDNYLIMRPFPQFETKGKNIKELWTDYRNKFIPLAGIAIFVFGNRKNKTSGAIERATGMIEEFEIAKKRGLMLIPVGATGYVAMELWQEVFNNFKSYFPNNLDIKDDFEKLGKIGSTNKQLIKLTIKIINTLNSK
jgi:hypothetical protein